MIWHDHYEFSRSARLWAYVRFWFMCKTFDCGSRNFTSTNPCPRCGRTCDETHR